MFNTENLLRNEVFPAELPPCFSTDDLAANATLAIATSNSFGQGYSIPLTYSGYKSESSRRKFALPNPYHYCKAVDFIVKNESQIKAILEKSKYSLTAPIERQPRQEQPYAKRSNTVLDTKREIECLFQENRYEIRLDINAFFDNIYTHCIPWVVHGIAVAKKHRNDMTLLGNQLDKLMRALNYDQTNGILVGNAVSRIISEIILCSVDEQISKKFPEISCCRFVDDYYIYVSKSSQIQEIISYIRTCLAQYELSFNENKIRITEGPFVYGNPWVEEIKQYIHLQPDMFLTKLIVEYNKCKDIAILKYGLKVISYHHYTKNSWPAIQSRLINLWTRFPSLSDRIVGVFWNNKDLIKINALINPTGIKRKDAHTIPMYISSKPARIIIAIPKSIKLLPNIIFFIMLFLHNFKLSLVYLSNLNGTTFPTTRPTKYTITLLCKFRFVIIILSYRYE